MILFEGENDVSSRGGGDSVNATYFEADDNPDLAMDDIHNGLGSLTYHPAYYGSKHSLRRGEQTNARKPWNWLGYNDAYLMFGVLGKEEKFSRPYKQALKMADDDKWQKAIEFEVHWLKKTRKWDLVRLPRDQNRINPW